MKQGVIEVEQGQLFYQIHGTGNQEIIWVHGLPLNSDSWYAQFEYFKLNYRNIAIDLRGYGKSSPLPENSCGVTELYTSDLVTLINRLKLNKPILVGFASGGHVTLRFAAKHNDLISKLVLINASPCFMKHGDWNWGFSQKALADFTAEITNVKSQEQLSNILFNNAMKENVGAKLSQLRVWFEKILSSARKETILAFFNDIAFDDDRELLKNISVPTLIISSLLGDEVPPAVGVYLRECITNSQLFELNDIDHFAFATQSRIINQVIDQFINPICNINIPSNKQ